MTNWFADMIAVLAMSKRIQWTLIIGLVFFIGINLLGEHLVSNMEFQGPLSILETTLKERVIAKYDKAALFVLVSSWIAAFKLFGKERHRVFY